MSQDKLSRLNGWCLALSGVLLALFFVLHPGGGDPPSAQTVVSSAYAWEHTLGVASMILMLAGLAGFYARHSAALGKLGLLGFVIAFAGTALLMGVMFFDAYLVPIIAVAAPQLLAHDGPLNTLPGLLALAVPGMIWGLGYVVLGAAILRTDKSLRYAALLLIAGSIVIDLPPQPVGPTPLFVIALGAVALGVGLGWLGLRDAGGATASAPETG